MIWDREMLAVFLFGCSCGMAFVNGIHALLNADREAQKNRHRWHDDG